MNNDKERLEQAKKLIKHYHEQKRSNNVMLTERGVELIEHLYEQAERVQELESFKNSVEYTVDSETLELIINNQDNDKVLSLSETYDEKIYLLQKRVQELEDAVESYKKTSKHANISHKMAEEQNKRYREALEYIGNHVNDSEWMSNVVDTKLIKAIIREALEELK